MPSKKLESFTCLRCLMSVKFGQRALTLISMGFGLLATGTLALAVATDYWLWTSEPLVKELTLEDFAPAAGISSEEYPSYENYPKGEVMGAEMGAEMEAEMGEDWGEEMDDYEDYEGGEGYVDINFTFPKEITMNIMGHSGLWRLCIVYEAQMAGDYPTECKAINYFGQDWLKRVEDADTTWSILRAIRKASPVIVFSLVLLIIAFSLSTIGNTKKDFRTISGAMIYVFAALFLAVGVILYISGVNDEMAHRKKPAPDGSVFEYHYGWAFFFAGSSFVTSLMASVTNLTLYLKRYPTIEDMASIIPGLDKKHNYNFSKVSSSADDLDVTVCSQNPTLIL